MTHLKEQILKLRENGKTYKQIQEILKCSKSLICYYLNKNQLENYRERARKYRGSHPFVIKIASFKCKKANNKIISELKATYINSMKEKIKNFKSNGVQMNKDFTMQDVINKIGDEPKCYLTGLPIDITKPRTYQFDHIIPASRGGSNSLDNLGICIKQANQAKVDMTPDEFINLCKLVLENQGYKLIK